MSLQSTYIFQHRWSFIGLKFLAHLKILLATLYLLGTVVELRELIGITCLFLDDDSMPLEFLERLLFVCRRVLQKILAQNVFVPIESI